VPFRSATLTRIARVRTMLYTIDRPTMTRRIWLHIRAQLMTIYILTIRRIARRLYDRMFGRVAIISRRQPRTSSAHGLKLTWMCVVLNRHTYPGRRLILATVRAHLPVYIRSMSA
jgi:hypothetical protein